MKNNETFQYFTELLEVPTLHSLLRISVFIDLLTEYIGILDGAKIIFKTKEVIFYLHIHYYYHYNFPIIYIIIETINT